MLENTRFRSVIFLLKTPISSGFQVATFDYRRVCIYIYIFPIQWGAGCIHIYTIVDNSYVEIMDTNGGLEHEWMIFPETVGKESESRMTFIFSEGLVYHQPDG